MTDSTKFILAALLAQIISGLAPSQGSPSTTVLLVFSYLASSAVRLAMSTLLQQQVGGCSEANA